VTSATSLTRIGVCWPPLIRNAPCPTQPAKMSPRAGASMTAAIARAPSTKPIITANSPLRSTNSRVPSTGSTKNTRSCARKSLKVAGSLSSATIGTPGNSRASCSQISALASRSASVTGSCGPLKSTANGRA